MAIYSSCWRIPGTEDCPSCTLTATLIGMPLPNHKSYIPCYIQDWSLKNQISGKCILSLLLHLWQFYHLSINQQVMLGANSLNADIPLQCTHLWINEHVCDAWKATLECWQPFNRLLGKELVTVFFSSQMSPSQSWIVFIMWPWQRTFAATRNKTCKDEWQMVRKHYFLLLGSCT